MKIYLDVCCLSRPFDNSLQDRIRLEAEAVFTIIKQSSNRKWVLLDSEIIDFEVSKIHDEDKRQKINITRSLLSGSIIVDNKIENRAIELEGLGFRSFDALHIACSEKGKADIFLTTDDDLLRKANINRDALKVRVENPIIWLMEVIGK